MWRKIYLKNKKINKMEFFFYVAYNCYLNGKKEWFHETIKMITSDTLKKEKNVGVKKKVVSYITPHKWHVYHQV